MLRYIGGELEIDEVEIDYQKSIDFDNLQNLKFYSTGRTAMVYLLESLDIKKSVLLPSYLCESILQPFKELGIPYEFYRINSDLTVDEDSLLNLIKRANYSVVYFINYFGFLTNRRFFFDLKKNFPKTLLIEDCTHTTFLPIALGYYDFLGDFVFGSLRKMLPLSDGAFILSRPSQLLSIPEKQDEGFSQLKFYGKRLRSISLREQLSQIESTYLKMLQKAEDQLNNAIPRTSISLESLYLLSNIDYQSVYDRRRDNYVFLQNKFLESEIIKNCGYLLRKITDSEMPYMLPFVFTKPLRDKLREDLRTEGIFTSVIWATPSEIPDYISLESRWLSSRVLCFPIDQRYERDDMLHIFNKFQELLLSNGHG